MRYIIIIEKGKSSYGAYVPDLPGCVAVAKTRKEVIKLIREAIVVHLDGLKENGIKTQTPSSMVEYVEV
jgi:predicted RNase H-like HicB family nuclease